MNDYDLGRIFEEIEIRLISSLSQSLDPGDQDYIPWQVKKLQEMEKFSKKNREILKGISQDTKRAVRDLVKKYYQGYNQADMEISRILRKAKVGDIDLDINPPDSFGSINNRKLQALISSVDKDFEELSKQILRKMDDVYRQTIYQSQVFLNMGAGSLRQAVDMATKGFEEKGINCITYSDGRKVNIASYARMALRTANKKAHLIGEGTRRDEWGIYTVLVSHYSACSPTCLPLQGRVYIDDVYSGGKPTGEYPLLSVAISQGLFHPNCRHTLSTWFKGISSDPPNLEEEEISGNYANLQKLNRVNNTIRKYRRLSAGATDPQTKKKYQEKLKHWRQVRKDLNPD